MRLWMVKQTPNPGQQSRPGPECESDNKCFKHGVLHVFMFNYDLIGNNNSGLSVVQIVSAK